jgi:site-specific DNA-methyltransferase (cytosine-N4-specific)
MNYLQILIGDSLTVLPTLAAESVQCCVTSPPYWGLRDYDHPAQIGAEPSPELYVENFVAIFREVRRVLRKDGTVWLNVGDGYARNGGTGNCGPNAVVGNTKKLIQKRNCKVPNCWDIQKASGGAVEWARRVRELRNEDGYQILSHKDRASLKPNQYLMETIERDFIGGYASLYPPYPIAPGRVDKGDCLVSPYPPSLYGSSV